MPTQTSPTTLPSASQCEPDTGTSMTRRGFLAGSAGVAAATTFTMGTRFAFASPENPGSGDVLVLVFLHGGADGLSLVAPFMMQSYRDLRPEIRVKDPGEFADPVGKAGLPLVAGGNIGAFDESGTFAMHPGMQSLFDGAWTDGNLAVTHCVGMPSYESSSRSHFDSTKNWNVGSGDLNVSTGFLNRYLQGQAGVDRLAAVGRDSQLHKSLAGPVPAYSMTSIGSFNVSGFQNNTEAATTLDAWYDGAAPDLLLQTGANTLDTIGLVTGTDWDDPMFAVQNGATYPMHHFAHGLRETAMLIRANVGLRTVAIDYHGWDTHEGMGMPEDPDSWFRSKASILADAMQAFYTDLGTMMDEVTLFSVSEFGRTINQNGNEGTDHGRGSCALAMGRKVNGGVYGDFVDTIEDGPEGDLTVLNDYRRPISEILSVRGGATDLGAVFPTYSQEGALGLCQT